MKLSRFFIVLMLIISSLLFAQEIPQDSLYLGQTPPGNTPKIFNLPVTNGLRPCERIAISADGKEIFYGELDSYPVSTSRVRYLKYQDNKWQGPYNLFEGFTAPKLSVNDSILYLQDKNFYTYNSKRVNTGWSTPVRLVSGNQHMHYFQTTTLNNSYASSYFEGSSNNGDICKMIIVNTDTILQSLGLPVNTPNHENDFSMAADESYLLFSRNVVNGAGDIYLSYHKANGRWTNPKKLASPINRPGNYWEYGEFISSDKKYLFYTSGGTSMGTYYTYWVKIDNIIDSLEHTNFIPYLFNKIPNQIDSVGYNYNYTFPDTTFIDDDGNNTLTYSATLNDGSPLPDWLSFNASTRTFFGTPTSTGNYSIKVVSTDTANAKATCTFNLKINNPWSDINDDQQILNDFKLFQNYPNPFNPTTNVEFYLGAAGRYKLDLYNSLGELVKNVFDREYNPGQYNETFDAAGLASGVYFYTLTGNNIKLINKMVILR